MKFIKYFKNTSNSLDNCVHVAKHFSKRPKLNNNNNKKTTTTNLHFFEYLKNVMAQKGKRPTLLPFKSKFEHKKLLLDRKMDTSTLTKKTISCSFEKHIFRSKQTH